MFGTSCRHEIGLSRDGLVTGAYNGVSIVGAEVGVGRKAFCAAHRCDTHRAAIKKTDRNFIGFTWYEC
jgi:hypothetical protein